MAADATVDTLIMGIIGFDELTVSADVEVQRTRRGLEVALVLDTTGSMSEGTKMPSLKAAANDLINILFGDQQTPELLRIGVVPFAAAVRLDPATAIAGGWIDEARPDRAAAAPMGASSVNRMMPPSLVTRSTGSPRSLR